MSHNVIPDSNESGGGMWQMLVPNSICERIKSGIIPRLQANAGWNLKKGGADGKEISNYFFGHSTQTPKHP